ncbi:MAG TPA: VWA domain-containing protein [Chthoniobacterales bacterium]|nr:VWA domain-containing protein [Chthoniobacterales bacterium]
MSFGAPHWLWGLLAVPALAVLFIRAEQRTAAKLAQFVSARLLPQLGAAVNPFRRRVRFALVLTAVALSVLSLAHPRWGYSYEEVKRKGLDLLVAVDTSRSMLANDVAPNRLQRVKLAAQDLFNELRGDRIGLIAFAGRSFLQAPLTIDYDAAVESLNDLDTSIIPEGGSNIADAITLAMRTFGQSAIGNRALIIFTDGEELSGDAVKAAKTGSDAGVKIFTVGVGTPEGSLIPLTGAGGTAAFVKDSSGQVVKSKLDEKRLREIAQATGGIYLHLAGGPATMKQLYDEGLAKMQAGDIQDRVSRQPIERYQWPLGGALLALAASLLINERSRRSRRFAVAAVYDRRRGDGAISNGSRAHEDGGHRPPLQVSRSTGVGVLLLAAVAGVHAAAPGLDAYRNERFNEAYEQFQQTLQEHPNTHAADKLHFDSGAAAYKMKDYSKALQSFSQALLSPDRQLQSRSHYNLGNTLYQRGETQKGNDKKLGDWQNALQHYEQTLKIEPENKEAKENAEFVKKKIEELKEQQEQKPSPTPSPSPNQQPKKDQSKQDQQQKDQQQQQKDQSGSGDDKKPQDGQEQSEQQEQGSGKEEKPGQTPSPSPQGKPSGSPSPSPAPSTRSSPSPGADASPSRGDEQRASPTPGEQDQQAPSPSPGDGEGEGGESDSPPNATPSATPAKKLEGEVKGAPQEQAQENAEAGAEAEAMEEARMTPQQAERLLRAMRDEEQRVQLDERKASRRVYNDW